MATKTKTSSRSLSREKAECKNPKGRSSSIDHTDNPIEQVFRAFSDRTRLRILHLLQQGETCVGDLVTVLELPQPRVSQQLSTLRNAGLVVSRKEGQWTHYSLAKPKSPVHRQLLECLKLCAAEVRDLHDDEAKRSALDQNGHCCS